jgi:tetratricopeptide (TPR) repeat protein
MHRSSVCLAIAVVLALGVTTTGIPASYAQSAHKKKTAKSYVDAGLAAQDAGDYDAALTFYGKAYELVPHPVLLFNMAQVHRLAGRPRQAVELYEQYVETDPSGPQVKTAREFIVALKNQIAAEETRKKNEAEAAKRIEEARRAEETRKAQEARAAEEARKAHDARQAAQSLDDESDEPHDETDANSGKTLRVIGYVGGAGGVVAIGVGTYFGLQARSLSQELSAPGAVYTPQKEADGNSANRNMIILTSVGAALVVGGGVAYWLGRKKAAVASGVAIAPTWSSGPGIVVGGTL